VDEILEVEMRLVSVPVTAGVRAKYHFDLYNIDFTKEENEVKAKKDTAEFDYSRGYANLVAQVEKVEKQTEYADFWGVVRDKSTIIHKDTYTVDQVVAKIVETFKTREFEANIRFPKGTYKKEHLPPENEIR
jgi:type III restriction enzyme